MTTHGVGNITRHEEFFLRDGNVCFVVERTMFRLHRYFFERESDYFRARLNPPAGDEDGSPDCPYIIDNVKSDEFAQFVWVWYNPQYSFARQGKPQWLTILRLATQWGFPEMRKLAIRHLEQIKFDPIEKIATYKQYAVENDLLLPSYMTLCTSPTLPSPEEGNILTLETVLTLASAREHVLLRASELGCKTPTIASAPEDVVRAVVAEIFGLTLHSNDKTVRMEGQGKNTGNTLSDNSVDTGVVNVKQPSPSDKKQKVNGSVSQASQKNVSSQNDGSANKGKQKP
ncbi:hypothetical protein HD554DRAFT_2096171 [Boletus coccyginus]|nr:hypothetical protein HD554DRAFT_2096171 [Boletus coccyginus]